MQGLTTREKAAWALILIKSFRNQGNIMTDAQVLAEQGGLSVKETKVLMAKLYATRLIIPTDSVLIARSPRLRMEYEIATDAYARYKELGEKSAEKNGTSNLHLVK